MRILVVHRFEVFRMGECSLLKERWPQATLLEAASQSETAELCQTQEVDLVLLDGELPQGSALELARHLQEHRPNIHTMVVLAEPRIALIRQFVRFGVSGCLLAVSLASELAPAVQAFLNQQAFFSQEILPLVLGDYNRILSGADPGPTKELSAQEERVLEMLAQGKRLKEIAVGLQIKARTVETYRRRISTKTGCHSTAELVRFAVSSGLIST